MMWYWLCALDQAPLVQRLLTTGKLCQPLVLTCIVPLSWDMIAGPLRMSRLLATQFCLLRELGVHGNSALRADDDHILLDGFENKIQ